MKTLFALLFILVPLVALAESTSGTVESISSEYGNLETSITSNVMDSLGIKVNDQFIINYGGEKITIYFGKTYSDVESGDWISFINWENKLRIARNHKNAAEALGAKVGDSFTISNKTYDY
tara:strand:+ start:89 stop:451 length:363 start_codon:yes stop_codon:yes gene_type:complete